MFRQYDEVVCPICGHRLYLTIIREEVAQAEAVDYRNCKVCGGLFAASPRRHNAVYCSEKCSRIGRNTYNRDYKHEHPSPRNQWGASHIASCYCKICGALFTARSSRAVYCSKPCWLVGKNANNQKVREKRTDEEKAALAAYMREYKQNYRRNTS